MVVPVCRKIRLWVVTLLIVVPEGPCSLAYPPFVILKRLWVELLGVANIFTVCPVPKSKNLAQFPDELFLSTVAIVKADIPLNIDGISI